MATVRELEIDEYLEGRCVVCECTLSEEDPYGGLCEAHAYNEQKGDIGGMTMTEWKIMRDGKLWSNRINSEELAYDEIRECQENGDNSTFEVFEMTEEEIAEYE